jgi:hypothetical protein
MVSKYSVVQYLPDPLIDERINIGVVAFSGDETRIRFLHSWNRVEKFALSNIDFVKEFSVQAYQEIPSQLILSEEDKDINLVEARFNSIFGNSINCIQFTQPKASLKSLDELVLYASQRFLVEPKSQKVIKPRDRQDAKKATVSGIRNALIKNDAKELLKTKYDLLGSRAKHNFDVVAANGKPLLAAHGISFEINEPRLVLDALAYRIGDVKLDNSHFPIAVVILPPLESAASYEQLLHSYDEAVSVYKNMGADVLLEGQISDWASNIIEPTLS